MGIAKLAAMRLSDRCAVVIPCLNEGREIALLVTAIRKVLPAVFVVDDGSTDNTSQAAGSGGAIVVRHEIRQGKGAALRTGCDAARRAGFTHALTMDGDGQHSPEDIPLFLTRLEATGAALIVGNRMNAAHGMPLTRRAVNWWMSHRLSKMCGQRLPDTQCGFRLMDLAAFASMSLSTTRFEMESEVLLAFAAAGHRIEFIPIRVIYGEERSKINPLKDTWRWFRWLRKAKRNLPGA